MMRLIYNKLLLIICLFGLVGSLNATTLNNTSGKEEFTKVIKKNFDLKNNGKVDLSNKYGDINLQTWNKDEVVIEVTITVKARSESSANSVFDRINVDFSNTSTYVKAETIIGSSKSKKWYSYNGNGGGNKGDFRIDYKVSMPAGADIDLSNKYGNSFMDDIGGDANISVKYGNFDMGDVNGETTIYLGYGNGTLKKAKDTEVEIKYSKLRMEEVGELKLQSKYSKIYLDKAGKVKSVSKYDNYDLGELAELSNEGKYDHFEIEKVGQITVYSKYTDFDVEELLGNASFDLRYGGVTIDELHQDFTEVDLECEYTDCKIFTASGTNFLLDAQGEYCNIRYPDDLKIDYEKNKDNEHTVKGHRGNANAGKIKARLRYGGLKVK